MLKEEALVLAHEENEARKGEQDFNRCQIVYFCTTKACKLAPGHTEGGAQEGARLQQAITSFLF